MTAAQGRQQLKLCILTDLVVRSLNLDTGLVKLCNQLVDGDFQNLSKL